MRARRTAGTVLIAIALLAAAGVAAAADDGGLRSVFARGAGERALGLGGAYGAVADDATAPFWNPAGLGRIERTAFQASHTDLIGMGFYEQYGSIALPNWRVGTFSLALRRFGTDGIEGRDDRGGVTQADLENAESELGLGYGRALGEAWAFGATLKYQQQNVVGHKSGGLGLDVGALVRPLVAAGHTSPLARSFRVGLAVRNLVEPTIRLVDADVTDPLGLRLGTSVEMPLGERHHLLAAVDVEKTRYMDTNLHAGLELVLLDLLALRVGSNAGTLAAGAGVVWRNLSVNYVFEDNELEPVHRFGLGVAFGPTTTESRLAAEERMEREVNERLARAFRADADRRTNIVVASVEAALVDGDYVQAREQVRALRVLAPEHPLADPLEARTLVARGRTAEADGDLAEAALAYQGVLQITPDSDEARTALARINVESDRRAQRSQELRALYDAGMVAYAADDLDAARTAFQRITELAPDDTEAANLLRLTEDAIGNRERATAAQAEAAEAVARARARATAVAPVRTEPVPDATTASAGAAVEVPAPVPPAPTFAALPMKRRAEIADLYRRGVEAAEANRKADAIRYWELVWSSAPDYRQVTDLLKQEYLAQGMEAFATGKLDRAIDIWEKALAVAPDDPRTKGYLERAYEHKARIRAIRSDE